MSDEYQRFYADYKNKLFSYLVYKSGDPDIAQEVVQDSFARHYERYGHKEAASPALLFTIARNALTDLLRSRSRFYPLDFSTPKTVTSHEDALIIKEMTDRVQQAVAKLTEIERNMLVMAVIGVPYKEIATVFDVSVANVKVRIHRARKRLHNILASEE